jgi:diguanylate cyclase (GGDEF)-like protein
MRTKILTAAIAGTSLVALVQPAVVAAEGPVPDLPAPPPLPNVTVTPSVGDGGAGIDVGVGETALQIGAGPGGLSLGTRPRGSTPTPRAPGADAGVPVRTPGDRPGRSLRRGSGSAVLFGPATGKAGAARAKGARGASPGSRGRRSHARTDPSALGADVAAANGSHRSVPPFLEFVERIPTAFKIALFALALIALSVWAAWVRARRRLERNAFVDPVTGIANEPAFDGLLERELDRARRYKRPLALLVLDVSEARHGRLLHDQALRAVTTAIRERAREGDIIARIGPSRFAIISPEATAAAADTLARALELRFEEMRLHMVVGAVERQPTDLSARHLLARAESAIASHEVARERPRGRALLRAA